MLAFASLLFFALPYHVNSRRTAAVAIGASMVLMYRVTLARILLHEALCYSSDRDRARPCISRLA